MLRFACLAWSFLRKQKSELARNAQRKSENLECLNPKPDPLFRV